MSDTLRLGPPPDPDPLSSPSFATQWAVAASRPGCPPNAEAPGLPSRPSAIPPILGDYELLAELGRGGMGVVYKARQISRDRIVALKTIRDPGLNARALERFRREIEAVALLNHPNIVPIHDTGEHEGQPFYTMAYVEGPSLAEAVSRCGPPSFADTIRLMTGVAEAVGHAHSRGIIHRDLKPANILLDAQGQPRVTDFGLARLSANHGLTGASQVLGTPGFMAPEQALGGGRPVGPESDVYSLGCVLYFLLAGKPPFVGETVTEVLIRSVQENPTSPRRHNPQVPPGLERVCLKCMEKESGRRYPDMRAFVEALTAADLAPPIDDHHEATAVEGLPVVRSPGDRRAWRAAAVLTCVLAAGASGFALRGCALSPTESISLDSTPPAASAPVVGEGGEPPPVVARGDFELKVTLPGARPGEGGQHLLTPGQNIVLQIEVDRDAQVGIWSVGADGHSAQIFPNAAERNALFRAGVRRKVPGNAWYRFRANTAEGPETLRIVASTTGRPSFKGEPGDPVVQVRTLTQRGN